MKTEKLRLDRRVGTWLAQGAALLISLFALYTATFGARMDTLQRGAVMLLVIIVIYGKVLAKAETHWADRIFSVLMMIAGVASTLYQIINYRKVAENLGNISDVELLLGILLVVALLDCTRRTIGWPIVIISCIFMAYAYFGPYLPGMLRHRGYSITRIVSHLYVARTASSVRRWVLPRRSLSCLSCSAASWRPPAAVSSSWISPSR